MAKQSYLLQQIEKNVQYRIDAMTPVLLQQYTDFAVIAFADWYEQKMETEVNPAEANEFLAILIETANSFANTTLIDAKDDAQINYTKGKLDQRLEQILGDYFIDFETRYGQ